MRRRIDPDGTVKLWLSSTDTYNWANRTGKRWPCSQLSGRRLFAEFYKGDLVDMAIDGRSNLDVDGTEFDAITSDFLGK